MGVAAAPLFAAAVAATCMYNKTLQECTGLCDSGRPCLPASCPPPQFPCCGCAASGAARGGYFEHKVLEGMARIAEKYGANWQPAEADINPGPANPLNMTSLESAAQVHIDAVHPNNTVPAIEALCNISDAQPTVCSFVYHTDPLLEDRTWPDLPVGRAGFLTAEEALARIRTKTSCPAFVALSFRWPVFPCASEHLYIFNCGIPPQSPPVRYFVGARTGNVCRTMSTERGGSAPNGTYCYAPENLPHCL
eukprot:TRINITY_DN47812_c0_g1_i1.p1 TRINITY_DN47812_c0_g1~~TRINITY_DN47812_c0_g1_i1.p1  ORF type:complete len:250 (+),score=26.51 TRINITY_DN47812_c0_g1_i1:80-829(+)